MAHDPRAIANIFINFAESERKKNRNEALKFILTAPQIEKLVYYAHAYHLHRCAERLISEHPVAGRFAPTFELLAKELEQHGNDPVICLLVENAEYRPFWFAPSNCNKPYRAALTLEERRSLENIWAEYVRYPLEDHQMSALIKGDESAWIAFANKSAESMAPKLMTDEHVRRFFELTCQNYGPPPGRGKEYEEAA